MYDVELESTFNQVKLKQIQVEHGEFEVTHQLFL